MKKTGARNLALAMALIPMAIGCSNFASSTALDVLIFFSLFILPGVFIFGAIFIFRKIYGALGRPPRDQR